MKKFNFILLLLTLGSHLTLAKNNDGIIFWTDLYYFKNNSQPLNRSASPYYNPAPVEPQTKPVLPPPVPPVEPPIAPPVNPTQKIGYIFYNKVFYPGKELFTGKSPLGGDLTVDTDKGVGMGSTLTGYTLTNENILTLNNNPGNTTTTGMQASRGGTIINAKTININALYGTGMDIITKGVGINEGNINLNSYYATGMQVYEGEALGFNNGTISGNGYQGAQVTGTGTFVNSKTGVINLSNGNVGIAVSGGGKALNDGIVEVTNTNFGMQSSSGFVINNNLVVVNGNQAPTGNMITSGMGASYSGVAVNNKTIDINSPGYSGMSGILGGIVVNNGTININVTSAPTNLLVDGAFAFQFANNSFGINSQTSVINLNEYGMVLNGNGTLHNWGKIIKPDSNTLPLVYEGGNLVMEKGGTVSSGTIETMYLGKSYIGDSYVLLAKADLDENTVKVAKNIKSNLYAYDLDIKDNQAIFKKINFTELTNDPLGDYLEDIYYDSSNSDKSKFFDIILSARNSSEFENYLNEIFGRGYFPTLIYQTRDAIEFGNNTIIKHLTLNPEVTSKERYILGYSFEKIEKGGYDNILGYKEELNSVFIGKNYPLNPNLSTGWILNYTRMDNKFKNHNGKREDNLFQGSGYLNYNRNNLNSFGALFLGYSKGDLDRYVNFSYTQYNETLTDVKRVDFNESLNSHIKSYYLGGMGQLSKTYDFGSFSVEPTGKLQSMMVFQKGINESNGSYNVDLDKVNAFLNTVYIGGSLSKEFAVKDKGVKLSLIGYLKQDLNSIHDNPKFKVHSLGNENGAIDIDNKNRFAQDLGLNVQIGSLITGLSVYAEYMYEFSKDNSWRFGGGISYIF